MTASTTSRWPKTEATAYGTTPERVVYRITRRFDIPVSAIGTAEANPSGTF